MLQAPLPCLTISCLCSFLAVGTVMRRCPLFFYCNTMSLLAFSCSLVLLLMATLHAALMLLPILMTYGRRVSKRLLSALLLTCHQSTRHASRMAGALRVLVLRLQVRRRTLLVLYIGSRHVDNHMLAVYCSARGGLGQLAGQVPSLGCVSCVLDFTIILWTATICKQKTSHSRGNAH